MTISHRSHPASPRIGRLGLIALAMVGALVGCQDLHVGHSGEGTGEVEKPERSDVRAKAGMIPVSDDLFMIPSGLDEDSCEMFRPFSANNPVKAAIHYRQADGSFGIARDPAVCQVEMASVGPDEGGCEHYRAVPVNADLPPLASEIVYYKSGDGRYSARKPTDDCS